MATRTQGRRLPFEVQEKVHAADAIGGSAASSWTTKLRLWGSFRQPTSRELYQGDRLEGRITHVIECPWHKDVTHADRIRFKGRTLEIVGPPINVGEMNRDMTISCTEVVPVDDDV